MNKFYSVFGMIISYSICLGVAIVVCNIETGLSELDILFDFISFVISYIGIRIFIKFLKA